MNIISTGIVHSNNDIYWQDIADITNDLPARPLLVVSAPLDEGGRAQLLKMLDASKLPREQYNILELEEQQRVAWHALRDQLGVKCLFLIGVHPMQLGVTALFRLNEPNRFNDTIWLPTLSIPELEQHADMKRQLWVGGMKPIFVDKEFGEL